MPGLLSVSERRTMETRNIIMTLDQRESLVSLAKATGRTVSDLIREAIDLVLNRYKEW